MLAGMYDASLNQFKPHNWYRPNIWPGFDNTISWPANGFANVNSEEFNKRDYQYLNGNNKTYDRLLSLYSEYGIRYALAGSAAGVEIRGVSSVPPPPPMPGQAVMYDRLEEVKMDGLAEIIVKGYSNT